MIPTLLHTSMPQPPNPVARTLPTIHAFIHNYYHEHKNGKCLERAVAVGYFSLISVNRQIEDTGSGPLPLILGFGPTLTKLVCHDPVANHKSNQARPRAYSAAYIRKGDPSRFAMSFTCFHT
jgi:hypothetical protein